jgi:FKBP12-rapamycin complex-associated protein
MRLLTVVNKLLKHNIESENIDLSIICYSVIPLSCNTGLIGWVNNCDTIK